MWLGCVGAGRKTALCDLKGKVAAEILTTPVYIELLTFTGR
jgi:hypothetical protein